MKARLPAEITLRFLPDGSVKIETDKVAPASHVKAERFLAEVQALLGGAVTKQRRMQGHHEHHHHDHEGAHDHDHA